MSESVQTDREAWLEARRQGIGASDVAGIIGVSPWTTPFGVWADKMGALDDDATEAMELGRRLENVVLDIYEEQTGSIVGQCGKVWVGPEDWMRCTLDGAYDDGLVEAKLSSSFGWDEIPPQYQCQAQWQMLVTGEPVCDFAVLHQGRAFRIYTLLADLDDQHALYKACSEFWRNHVLTGEAPPVVAEDVRTLGEAYEADGTAAEIDESKVRRLVEVKARIKEMTGLKDSLQAQIEAELKEAELGTFAGKTIVSWKTQERKGYTVAPSTQRVFRIHWKEDT